MNMYRIDTVQRWRRELVGGWSRNLEVFGKGRVHRDVEHDSSVQIEVRGFLRASR